MKYYDQTVETVLKERGSDLRGLEVAQVDQRLEEFGSNALKATKKKSLAAKFLAQIKDPMIIVLLAAALISGVFQEIADMVIILLVIVINAVLGIVQENKAENAIEALAKMSAPHSKVRRGGQVQTILSEDIVPGDIVLLEAGDSVPADIRLTLAISLKVEEAALTGESVPVDKSVEPIDGGGEDVSLGDRVNMAFMGTNVVYGRAEGVVIETGMSTQMGKIAHVLASTIEEKTPLQKKLGSLSKVLSIAVLAICALIFMIGLLRDADFTGEHIFELLLGAVSLAVAAIPEGLVVVVTVVLSIGVTKMSKRNAIIRRLTAVETLGCTQVICSDKTGTLTQNKMTVVDHKGPEELLATAMSLCSDIFEDADGNLAGEPTELALGNFAKTIGLGKKALDENFPRVGEAPFDSLRKMMSTIHRTEDGSYRQFTKGAPDEVLDRCDRILIDGEAKPLADLDKQRVSDENHGMAARALRVLGAAYRTYAEYPADVSPGALETEMTFIGLVGMIDPVRPEAKRAIEQCYGAGIRPVMITGDHKDTAVAIAKELNILQDESGAITGADMAKLSDSELECAMERYSVYARVQPEHKVRIVDMWKRKGKITAMTGDGVNDAPALKNADIGIGMGITGTDVTKNVADMVLTDDNFATIVRAVEEGRKIYENIRKSIQFLLGSNLSEVVAIFVATLAGFRLFAPIHILWINLITDTFPAIALGMEEAEKDVMSRPPRNAKESIFAGGLGVQVIYQGVLIAGLTLWSFFIGRVASHETGMTMAFMTLSMCEIFHSMNLRSRTKSLFQIQTKNHYIYLAMVLSFVLTLSVMYIPGLNDAFSLVPLTLAQLGEAVGIAFLVLPIVEIVKFFQRLATKKA